MDKIENEIINPTTGTKLTKTEENTYYDPYLRINYYMNNNGKLLPLTSPISGNRLSKNIDGTYTADGKIFELNDQYGVLPKFIPDNTYEEAHLDGNYLVGNITGRRFPIREDGQVIVPFDPHGTKESQLKETQEYIDSKIREDERLDNLALSIAKIKQKIRISASKVPTIGPIELVKSEDIAAVDVKDIAETDDFNNEEWKEYLKRENIELNPIEELKIIKDLAKYQYAVMISAAESNTEEKNELIERIKKGHVLSDEEIDIIKGEKLIEERVEEIKNLPPNIKEQEKEINDIKSRIHDGQMLEKDFMKLCEYVGFNSDMTQTLKALFSAQGKIIFDEKNQTDNDIRHI